MNIEEVFNILTGNTDNTIIGKVKGTTKATVREMCGEDWDEKIWKRMVSKSNRAKGRVNGELPFYDKNKKLWFWY